MEAATGGHWKLSGLAKPVLYISQSLADCEQAHSGDPDVFGLPAFRSLDHVKLNRLAFLKRAKSLTLDG